MRRILGWERSAQVPSEATFSRAFAEFAQGDLPDKMHAALIERALGGRIIGAIARDATEIKAREKPVEKSNNDKDGPSPPPTSAWLTVGVEPQRKRGRPRKGRSGQTRSHHVSNGKQCTTSLGYSPISPPRAMSAPRRTARAVKETWIGYKLHIDVASGQIPVACVLTSASVHDSQVAIPLMTMTSARVFYLYDLMDSAYDAAATAAQSVALGRVPLIDRKFRAQHEAKSECVEEVARMKFIHLPDPDDVLYDFRTMVERINGRFKDEFVRVRGAVKIKCHLMFGILALTVDQKFRVGPFTPALA